MLIFISNPVSQTGVKPLNFTKLYNNKHRLGLSCSAGVCWSAEPSSGRPLCFSAGLMQTQRPPESQFVPDPQNRKPEATPELTTTPKEDMGQGLGALNVSHGAAGGVAGVWL